MTPVAEFVRLLLEGERCAGCGAAGGVWCAACRPLSIEREALSLGSLTVSSLARYEGSLRKAIRSYKGGRRALGPAFASALRAAFRETYPVRAAVVPVPTSAQRQRERGFDHTLLLARAFAGARTEPWLIQRDGPAQRGKSRRERLERSGRFECRSGVQLAGRAVVLLDDVVTTGATLAACAAVAEQAGATVLGAIVLARTAM